MPTRIAINGFGRIGRCILRALYEEGMQGLQVVAINDLASSDHMAHLLKYDSVHGRFNETVTCSGDALQVRDDVIRLSSEAAPENLPWQDIDVVFECTGRFKSRDAASRYLQAGAKRVLISAPSKDADRTIVYGVNHRDLTWDDVIVSNASCTTNCLAPIAQVMDDAFGIETGYITTVHAYTGDQPTHDRDHSDLFRARAAALSMVPTSTGAARAISQVLPHLEGRLEGSAIRVPTANVSLVDFCFMPKTRAPLDAVNQAAEQAANGPLKGILGVETDPLVSVDFNHSPLSSIFAPAQTAVTQDGLIRLVCWYDNEWGFSNRMIDAGALMGDLLAQAQRSSGAAN